MYYLAVDIGASGGRHILGTVENEAIVLEEIYRFQNGPVEKDGRLCWDVQYLFKEIKAGMKKCMQMGKIPVSMGIDCFGVDFVLLDKDGEIIGDAVSYRDRRTEGLADSGAIDKTMLYQTTGTAIEEISSIYQLISIRNTGDELNHAERFLQLPDYFHYLLTGIAQNEYTNSQTTLLINPEKQEFDNIILKTVGIPEHIFERPVLPMTKIGRLRNTIQKEVGFDCEVVLPATHDTVSALMSVTFDRDALFISSGTWSMMGAFIDRPILSGTEAGKDYSNMYIDEGVTGYVKGITGMWMIQSVKRELNDAYSYEELYKIAMNSGYAQAIDVDDRCFMAPESMIEAVKNHLKKTTGQAPEDIGDILNAIYHGLAKKYMQTAKEIEDITGKTYQRIQIVGGGSKNTYLNHLTAVYTGKEVHTGPAEATAMGNLLAQMVAMGRYDSLEKAKKLIK